MASSSAERFGLDSNVLVYLVDAREPARQARAREVVELAAHSRRCVLSTQNLGEFFNVVTRKGLASAEVAQRNAHEFMTLFEFVRPDAEDVRRGMAERAAGRLGFWDAHLLSTLERAGCAALLSEDMGEGARLGGLVVRNPFAGEALPEPVRRLLGGGTR